MKKKFWLPVLVVLTGLISIAIWQPWLLKLALGRGSILKQSQEYRLINEHGNNIDAEFYLRKVGWARTYVVIRFTKLPPEANWPYRGYYLIIVPDSSWIGRPNQGKEDYRLVFNNKLYQSESGAHFKIINTNGAGVYQMSERSGFKNDTIRFNTFHPIDQLGKEIIMIHR